MYPMGLVARNCVHSLYDVLRAYSASLRPTRDRHCGTQKRCSATTLRCLLTRRLQLLLGRTTTVARLSERRD